MTDPFSTPGEPPQSTGPTFNQQPTQISQQYSPPPQNNSWQPQNNPPPQNNPWQPQTSPGQPQFNPPAGQTAPPPGDFQYYGGGQPPVTSEISMGARIAAYIVSALKAIPLIIVLIFGVFLAGSSNSLGPLDGIAQGFAAVLVLIALLGFALVIGQIVTAAKNSRTGLLVFASIMLAIDALIVFFMFIGLAADSSNGYSSTQDDTMDGLLGLFILVATAAAQLYIVIGTAKSQKSTPAPAIYQQQQYPPKQP